MWRSGRATKRRTQRPRPSSRATARRSSPSNATSPTKSQILESIEQTAAQLGRIDACFANAGYGAPGDPLKMSLEKWRELLSVNFDGAFLTMRCCANHMIETGGSGKLVVTSSMVENFGSPMQVHYAAGKAGVGSMVKSLAVRLARYDIQVNSIQPGWVVSEQTQAISESDDFNKVLMKRIPARRWGDNSDFEGIAVYFASDASRYHTGDSVLIDGGYTQF